MKTQSDVDKQNELLVEYANNMLAVQDKEEARQSTVIAEKILLNKPADEIEKERQELVKMQEKFSKEKEEWSKKSEEAKLLMAAHIDTIREQEENIKKQIKEADEQ